MKRRKLTSKPTARTHVFQADTTSGPDHNGNHTCRDCGTWERNACHVLPSTPAEVAHHEARRLGERD